jgi:hypothetical protein
MFALARVSAPRPRLESSARGATSRGSSFLGTSARPLAGVSPPRASAGRPARRGRAASLTTRATSLPPLVPADADDALARFRKVMTVLYAAGGALHFPDLFGAGPISGACDAEAFADLSPLLQAVTLGWATLGPIAAFGLGTGRAWGDAVLVGVASTEIVLGVDFAEAMAPSPIPPPVVGAQTACLVSVVAIYLWKKSEENEA